MGEREDWNSAEEAELERLVRESGTPARDAFRDDLREAFVRGRLEPDGEVAESPGSASQGDEAPRSDAHGMLEHILNKARIAEPARVEFREDLRARFVSGDLGAEDFEEDAAPSRGPRVLDLLTWAAPIAVAAALLLVFVLGKEEAASWRVHSIEGRGPVIVDGVELASLDTAKLEQTFASGGEISTGERRLDLDLGESLRLRLEPGSRLQVAAPDASGHVALDLTEGEVHGLTGPDFDPYDLAIDTPRGAAHITGTGFSILAVDAGACFCVDHGTVEVTEHGGGDHRVGGDTSLFLYADGHPASVVTPEDLGHFPNPEARALHMAPFHAFLAERSY